MEKVESKNIYKFIFILLCITFSIPSIMYLIKGGTIENLISSFTFFYTKIVLGVTPTKICETILFLGIFLGISYVYFQIIKNHKIIFKSKKEIAIFIVIIAIIFMMILPLTSTDVFYYIGTGWSEAHYKVNPYYTSVKEVMQNNEIAANDVILQKMVGTWGEQTIVYGPIWPLVCKILSGLSFGNLTLALIIYKLFNVCLHLANAYLVYKITKGKNIFTLIYALNPLVLFDGISNVHNEMLVIFFILLALYFFIRKKNMFFTIVFFALATATKYFAVLLVPFIVIYYYRKEKPLKRVLYSCLWAIIFIAIFVACYIFYMKDFNVLNGIIAQQKKLANSLFLCIGLKDMKLGVLVARGFMVAFIAIYIITIVKLLFNKKQYSIFHLMRTYNVFLIAFLFAVITNFQTWYTLWLLPTIMWQNSKNIKWIISITIIVELANAVFFLLYENYTFQLYFFIIVIVFMIISNKICSKKFFKEEKVVDGKNITN